MTPPQTGLTGHPPKRTTARAARFAFSASEAGSSFRCKLDRGAFRPCVSPQAYRGLKLGPHRFKVIATDASGNADATPAGFGWKVLAKPRR
jgi:hypothetical protein